MPLHIRIVIIVSMASSYRLLTLTIKNRDDRPLLLVVTHEEERRQRAL